MAKRVADHHVGAKIDCQSPEPCELRAVEDEDLGDQQPDEDPAEEPSVGVDP